MTIALGLDLGSTTTKTVLVDVARSRILRTSRARTPDDVPSLLAAVAGLIRDCAGEMPIAAIGISSMAETGAAFDRHGMPLTPLLRWDRAHTHAAHERLRRAHPDLPERTGIPDTPKPALVTLHGMRESDPDLFARMARWQGVADLVAAALTGSHATDHTLAARTMLLDPDAPERRWNSGLLAELGLSAEVLPRIARVGEPVGSTTSGALGLPAGIPVHIAGHDHAVGAWGAGVRRPGDVVDSLGTAEAIMAVTERADHAAVRDGFSIGRTVDDEHATIMGGSAACGALLADWPGDPVRLLADERLDAWRTSPVTVLPYPRGRQCPHPDPNAGVRILGEPLDEGDVPRGVLQSLVLHARWMRSAMSRYSPPSSTPGGGRLVLIGSLAERIPAWAPLTAAATGAAVHRCTASEPVAASAALLAAVRGGLAPDTTTLDTIAAPAMHATGLDDAYDRLRAAALETTTHTRPSEGEK